MPDTRARETGRAQRRRPRPPAAGRERREWARAQAGPDRQARAAARLLRRLGAAEGHRPRVRRQRGDRDHRAVGVRQVDARALHQPHARGDPRRAGRGQGAARRVRRVRPRGRRGRGAARDRHGLPEAEPVPDDVGVRQRRRGPAPDRGPARRRAREGRAGAARRRACGTRSPSGCTSRAWGCRAASSSACASPARWRSIPR